MSHITNTTRIKAVYNALGELRDLVVFVGGAVVSLYAERKGDETRETDDVDVLVEIYTHQKFAELEDKLRSIGFVNDKGSKFVGRYKISGFVVDIMAIDAKVLGFSNLWYKEGFKNAVIYPIDEHVKVKIFSAPYFLATKLEAFNNRGENDGRTSTDFEDIVMLLVNRPSIWKEIQETQEELKAYLIQEFEKLLSNPYLEEWIDAHTGFVSPVAHYVIIPQIKELLNSGRA